jgi:hypothetical protein
MAGYQASQGRQTFQGYQKSRDKRLGRPVTLAEALKASFEIHLEKKDPVQKEERAKGRLEAKRVPIRRKLPAWVTPRSIPKYIVHEVNLRDRGECSYKYIEFFHTFVVVRRETRARESYHPIQWPL